VDLVHVQDVADFVVQVLENERSYGEAYNVANPVNPSWNQFLKIAAAELDVPVPQRHISYPLASLPQESFFDIDEPLYFGFDGLHNRPSPRRRGSPDS
jgi:nucleoside-diphosphate-sugar epimerase